MLTKTKPGAAGGDAAKKGGTSKQTAVGVDVRNLEDEESDARYFLSFQLIFQCLRLRPDSLCNNFSGWRCLLCRKTFALQ